VEEYVYQITHTYGLNTNPTTLGKKTMRKKYVITVKVMKAEVTTEWSGANGRARKTRMQMNDTSIKSKPNQNAS